MKRISPIMFVFSLAITTVFCSPLEAQSLTPIDADLDLNPQRTSALLKTGRNRAIAGSVLFFVAAGLEYGVISPWAYRASNSIDDPEDPSTEEMSELLTVLLASVPVSALKLAGPLVANAGASTSYETYRDGVDNSIPDIRVWKPYQVGWVFRVVGGLISFVGGLAGEDGKGATYVGTATTAVGDVLWGASCISSIAYSSKRKRQAEEKLGLSVRPFFTKESGGLVISGEF